MLRLRPGVARPRPGRPGRGLGDEQIGSSGTEQIAFARFAVARFELAGEEHALELYWLSAYGGGLFVPFRDATSGAETYGGGRYLLDTVKGSDLGMDGDRLVLDFNFAYNPSCSYDPRWVCPLSPPANRLPLAVRAGERMPTVRRAGGGTRTRGTRFTKPVLCQLSYSGAAAIVAARATREPGARAGGSGSCA